jgi:hypothetical protein
MSDLYESTKLDTQAINLNKTFDNIYSINKLER